jgi:hypothetical protein
MIFSNKLGFILEISLFLYSVLVMRSVVYAEYIIFIVMLTVAKSSVMNPSGKLILNEQLYGRAILAGMLEPRLVGQPAILSTNQNINFNF